MTSREIRAVFLDYFKDRGHRVVPSSSLIPANDPTLLFTNAGMVQFKSAFTGDETLPYSRAVSCQKCMRAGGKHNDIENVGHTARHHTFFEMLGNFSFGDYFKKEAIIFAWELLTEFLRLPTEKLWISVYEKDDEAYTLWTDHTGIPGDRIVRLGEKDNFWQMGDTGPCGPSSEILVDQGADVGCGGDECAVGCDCDRFLEIWNLVFMQFNRDREGKLSPLPKPSIDTGMGLERITAVLQGKLNNFDTDLFAAIISAIESLTGVSYNKSDDTDVSIRVMADHMRSVTFLISEGLVPSNEGSGYVLRRVIRRAARHARLLGVDKPVLYQFVDAVMESMGSVYPEIIDERERIGKILKIEEEKFLKTLQQGVNRLDVIISEVKNAGAHTIDGKEIFRLYDTFGFPVDLARDMAIDSGLNIDEQGFSAAMELQKEKARASWVAEDAGASGIYKDITAGHAQTAFVGYDSLRSRSTILAIVKSGRLIDTISEGEEAEIILDVTPFYGESGGQTGDTGVMTGDNAKLVIVDTKKPVRGFHVHIVKLVRGTVRVGDIVTCEVDGGRRRAIMRNHTAAHLLHASLKNVLGEHVKQSGSFVSDEKLRFDFTHFHGLEREEIQDIEITVNDIILDNREVITEIESLDQAISSGAVALFGEKYGETVRVVSVKDFSKELCGGTHCGSTGEIGPFKIVSEGSVASGIRRIEALTGHAALDYFRRKEGEAESISAVLKTDNPVEKVGNILEENKALRKEMEKLKTSLSASGGTDIIESVKEINGVKVLAARQDGLTPNELRTLSDKIREKIQSGVIFLASVTDERASMLCAVTKDLQRRYHAGEILKKVAAACEGRGGGSAHMAQGGAKEIGKLDKALQMIYDIIKEAG